MRDSKTIILVKTALFMALIVVSTFVVQIPSPTKGYFNLGDCFIILAAWIIGPIYGMIASGIGSMLTDIMVGVPYYAIGTLFIKGLAAFVIGSIVYKKKNLKTLVFSSIVGEIIIVLGYFLYSALILSNGIAALSSIPGNAIQGVIGIILALGIYHTFKGTKLLNK